MGDQTETKQLNNKNHRITSIIAAYNEEKTIGPIIDVLKSVPIIEQIVVVSDGSNDLTFDIARSRNVEVVDLISNVGKGGALYRGLEYIRTDVVLLLDADLVGLEESHVLSLFILLPKKADVTIGVFEEGRFATDFARKLLHYYLTTGDSDDVIQNISDLEVS